MGWRGILKRSRMSLDVHRKERAQEFVIDRKSLDSGDIEEKKRIKVV